MKVCNYCGTGMDNSVMKCPFCRMEMDMRGAIKYQDNEPFDPNKPPMRARDGKTPAELRYEAMLSSAHEEHGLSYKNLFKSSEDLTIDAKSLLDKEREKEQRDSKRSEILSRVQGEIQSESSSQAPKIELNLPAGNPQAVTKAWNLIKIIIIGIVFISIVISGIVINDDYDSYYEDSYPSAEEFVPGSDEDGVYTNKYTGIEFDSNGICDYTDIFSDDDNLWFSEFYAQDETAYMYITYINADYSSYQSAEEILTDEEAGTSASIVSHDLHYICGYYFDGITTYTEFEDDDDGEKYGYFTAYMVCQVTEEYYAVIEIVAAEYDDIAVWIDGFSKTTVMTEDV